MRLAVLSLALLAPLSGCGAFAVQRMDPTTWQTFNESWNESMKVQLVWIKHRADEIRLRVELTNLYEDPISFDAKAIKLLFNGEEGNLVKGKPDFTLEGGESMVATLWWDYDTSIKAEGGAEITVQPHRMVEEERTDLPPARMSVTITTIAGDQQRY